MPPPLPRKACSDRRVGRGADRSARNSWIRIREESKMQRVAVVGSSGSGKTTLASELARLMDCPSLELDSVYHQANWKPLDVEKFRQRVGMFLQRERRWVIDGNYHAVRELIWRNADTVVWLDLPRPIILSALLSRTLRRGFLRQKLWNGNRENLLDLFSLDPERSVLVWSYTRHATYVANYEAAGDAPENGHLNFVRLRSRREVAAWLDARSTRDCVRKLR